MYLFDPDRGRRRRALVKDQMIHALNKIDDAIGAISRDLRNRGRGVWASVRSVPRGWPASPCRTKFSRSACGRSWGVSSPPGFGRRRGSRGSRIPLGADPGPRGGRSDRGRRPRAGGDQVEERLDRHEHPDGISGLQGGRFRPGERSELCQANWSPTARLLVGSAGTALFAAGAGRRGVTGLALGALGTGLLVRAVANIPMSHWLGSEGGAEPREANMVTRAAQDRGEPGGGRGRNDAVGRTGVYPGSGPYPAGEAAVRTPATFVHGQRDAEGREESGGSEPIYFNRETLLVGETPLLPPTRRRLRVPSQWARAGGRQDPLI